MKQKIFNTALFMKSLPLAVLLVGGMALAGSKLEPPGSLFWRLVNDTGEPRARHENAFAEAGGKFYLLGGRGTRRMEIFNPVDSTWTEGPHAPAQKSLHHFQAAVVRDTIYVVGAYTETFPDEDTVTNIYLYDPINDQWEIGPAIPLANQRGAAAVGVYNDKLYVVGGSVGGHGASAVRLTQFDEYDPLTDTWTPLPDAPRARDHVQAAVVGDKLYVVGGRNGNQVDNVSEVDIYNFLTGTWSSLPSPAGDIPTPRGGATTLAVGDYVVVIGGESSQQLAHDEVEALNTLTNTWVTLNPLVIGRHGTQAIFYNDNIYIAAGSGEKGGGPELTSLEVLETNGQTNLPVELAPAFNAIAHGASVTLHWRTLSESNNAGFEVQHQQGSHFEPLGFVEGYGTSVVARNYQFEIKDLPPGRHVFRLKQIDFNGGFEYSPEISSLIAISSHFHLGDVYPNPFNPQARFTLTLALEQHVRIEVYDLLGRNASLIHDGILLPHEPHTFTIQAEEWAGGKYMLHVKGTYFSSSQIFTVVK